MAATASCAGDVPVTRPISIAAHPCVATCFAVLALVGCEDRGYPEGFAAQAARDEASYTAPASSNQQSSETLATSPAATTPASAAGASSYGQPAASGQSTNASTATVDGAAATDFGAIGAPDPRVLEDVIQELALPSPPPVEPTAGDEPYQKLARDRKFDEFRRMSARYVQLKRQLLPLGRKLAEGVASPNERALHTRIEDAIAVEFPRLNRYIWDDRWSEQDRAAMGWILFVTPE